VHKTRRSETATIFAGEQDVGVDVLATRILEIFFDGNAMIDIN